MEIAGQNISEFSALLDDQRILMMINVFPTLIESYINIRVSENQPNRQSTSKNTFISTLNLWMSCLFLLIV